GPPPQGPPPQGPPPGQYPGGPGGYWQGQYPPAGYPPPKPKKKWYQRVWFWILAVIVVSIMASCFGGGSDQAAGSADTSSSAHQNDDANAAAHDAAGNKPAAKKPAAKKKAPAMAQIGDSVTSGHFKFTVTKVQKGVSRVGDSYLGEKAQGQFVLVSVKVTNVGDSSEMFMGSEQKLFDKAGKEYSADDEAGIYLDESNSFLEDINPGNTVNGTIVFDVPKTITPKYIEFSGALFSSSVKVALG
ncbi:DUF4352 domain-containing protein, partial [Spelaeicoccus albus]